VAAVTKSSGKYFYENDRVWQEAKQTGMEPFFVGNWGGKIAMPDTPTKDFVRDVSQGTKYLQHVQANRVGGYDLTFTFDKKVSIFLNGLTPHDKWPTKSTPLVVAATRPEVERFVEKQLVNSGAQGKLKQPSRGAAVGFIHWESSRNVVQTHAQYWVPNLSAPQDGPPKSIANAGTLFKDQGLMRARANKRMDDALQDRAIVTCRVGKVVSIPGIPDEMAAELSPSRRAMNEAMKKEGFTTPKAQDFYARHARREAGPRTLGEPAKFNEICWEIAKKHGVTPESIMRPANQPALHRDKVHAACVAHEVVTEARDSLAAKLGTFTKEQFLERAFTLSIGKATNFEAVDVTARTALEKPKLFDMTRQRGHDGSVRYAGPASKATTQQAEQAFRPDTKEAWEELKRAAKGLGASVFIATTGGAARALKRLAEAVNPPPRIIEIDAAELPAFIDKRRPTHYVVAHAKALLAGMLAPGNPHQKADVAQRAYRSLRSHDRVPKNAVIVVSRGSHATARELHLLSKIAKRDKASVILADRPGQALGRNGRGHGLGHGLGL